MKNLLAFSILIIGISFIAIYGWINRYEYISNELSGPNMENSVSLVTRINIFTGERCALIPPSIFLPYIEKMKVDEVDEIMWCFNLDWKK